MKRKTNYTTTLIVLLLVAAGTYYNARKSPVEVPSESGDDWMNEWLGYFNDNEWENVTRFDIDFWYLKGSTLEKLSLEGDTFSYEKGGYRLTDNPVIPTGNFILTWRPLTEFQSWQKERNQIITLSGDVFTFNNTEIIEEAPYISWQEHNDVNIGLNKTGAVCNEMTGFILGHRCEETDRIFVSLYYDYEHFDPYSPTNGGVVFSVAYRCHPVDDSPIHPFVGQD